MQSIPLLNYPSHREGVGIMNKEDVLSVVIFLSLTASFLLGLMMGAR